MSPRPSRLACVDALKAVSSHLIVLHHLAFYGPMSDAAQSLAPGLIGWLSDYARIAVQVFRSSVDSLPRAAWLLPDA